MIDYGKFRSSLMRLKEQHDKKLEEVVAHG